MRRLLPYALFLILVCLFLWRPVFTGAALLPGDYLSEMKPWQSVAGSSDSSPQWNPLQYDAVAQFYQWRVFYARSMQAGHIPLWNPHQFSGTPFLANGQSAVLYPLNLLFLVVDPITGFTIFAVLHLFLAASFTYLLLRDLRCSDLGGIVGGICFAFCSFMVLWLELPTFISVACWLPLVLLLIHRAVERRSLFYGMLSGTALGITFLAGHFQIAFYAAFAAALWWLWKLIYIRRAEGETYAVLKVVVPFIGCTVVAFLIACAQFFPSQELSANSHRLREPTHEGYARFVDNGVKPHRFIAAFVPDFFGNPSRGDYWALGSTGNGTHVGSTADYMEFGLYGGILPLLLAMLGVSRIRNRPHVGFFAVLAVVSVLVAAGTHINVLFYYGVPGFSALGGPNRILVLYLFSIAVLAGFGVDYFAVHAGDKLTWRHRKIAYGSVAAIAALMIGAGLFALTFLAASEFASAQPWNTFLETAIAAAFLPIAFFAVSVVLLVSRARFGLSRAVFSSMVVVVIILDLFAFGINYNPVCDHSLVYPQTELTEKLTSLDSVRIAPINRNWSLFKTPGAVLPPNAAMVYGFYDVQGYDSLYTRVYKDISSRVQDQDSSPVENGNIVFVRSYKRAVGFFADYVLVDVDDSVDVSAVVLVGTYDGVSLYRLSRTVPATAIEFESGGQEPVTVSHSGPNSIMLSNKTNESGTAAVRTLGYPGWSGFVNGERVQVNTSDFGVSAAVAPGESITFSFEPYSFRLGLFLMLVGVGMLSCVGVYRAVRYRYSAR